MNCKAKRIPYQQTNSFTKLVLDYLNNEASLKPFYAHNVSLTGIQKAIAEKSKNFVYRNLLVDILKADYSQIKISELLRNNIESLQNKNTFTVTTAHQPNIFTGPLYFIYKIIHAIKLTNYLNLSFPKQHFVPVYFMGSEDADLDELGHTFINHDKIIWNTSQKGAVGRMNVDKDFVDLINQINGQLSVEVFGEEVMKLIKDCYQPNARRCCNRKSVYPSSIWSPRCISIFTANCSNCSDRPMRRSIRRPPPMPLPTGAISYPFIPVSRHGPTRWLWDSLCQFCLSGWILIWPWLSTSKAPAKPLVRRCGSRSSVAPPTENRLDKA